MIVQKQTSSNIKVNEFKEVLSDVSDKPIEPLDVIDLDIQLSNLKIEEPKIGNLVKDKQEQKNLSILKKVSGVIDYFQDMKKDKTKSSIPKYLYDLTMDILYLEKCQLYTSPTNICYVRLPLVVISNQYYIEFISFLNDYYLYSEYKDNINLAKYLILSDTDIENYKPFHESKNPNYTFIAECINTGLVNHYKINQILEINKGIEKYFADHNIKGLSIDIYYDLWLRTVMDELFQFVMFQNFQTPNVTICQKCKKDVMFIENDFNINNFNKNYLYEQVYQDIKENETYPKSIDIANNIMNNIDLTTYVNTKNKTEIKEESSVNFIYYDENMFDNYKEVVSDAKTFEKECNGTFLLISNTKSFLIMLDEFKKNKQYPKFHLICPGSQFVNLAKTMKNYENIGKIIKTVVIYTLNAEKYEYLKTKYNVKGIFTQPQEVMGYIKSLKSKNNIKYNVPKLITFYDYGSQYIEFHKIISLQYGKLYQKSSYLTALNILEEYLLSNTKDKMDSVDISILLQNLEIFSAPQRDYKKIIQEYTNDSFYRLFNKWLNEVDPLAIKKIAFFISGLQLSLNIYGFKEKKGFNSKAEIYRGVLLDYSLILNYLKNIGNIITFPSFFSTSLDKEIAHEFAHYNKPKNERNNLFSTIYFINVNPRNSWISQGFRIDAISYYEKEKEILFQPFCFFKLTNVKVSLENYTCFIYLELIGKKEIWEQIMDDNCHVSYEKEENLIELKKY